MYRILIVEDDPGIAKAVAAALQKWELDARCVTDFRNVMAEFAQYDPHLVLLDISLPFFNGYHWCSEIRRVSKIPVIFISSASDNMNIFVDENTLTVNVNRLRKKLDAAGLPGFITTRFGVGYLVE